MTQIIELKKHRLEVAQILQEHVGHYQKLYPLWPEQRKVISDLLNCRTAYLGGHLQRCTHCGIERIQYNSCRNRHCPKCQHMPRERWLAKRKAEILPTTYFHVVFTLPHELNPIMLNNKTIMLNMLFKAVSQTLLAFGNKELGATGLHCHITHLGPAAQRPFSSALSGCRWGGLIGLDTMDPM